jgi:two-component system NtrC family sensor kinase
VLGTVVRIGQIQNSLENIRVASDKTRNIVQALKRYTHTSHQESVEPVNLLDSINTILILYAFQIRQQTRLKTNFEVSPVVMANSDKLGQVWTNLIMNALQAMEPNGKLVIDIEQDDHFAWVHISDTGKGIPPEILPHIFEPFFTTKGVGEGTGLGLNICKEIVESYGGTIAVRSVPGNTIFTIMLPLASNQQILMSLSNNV